MSSGLELARKMISGGRHKVSLREARENIRISVKDAAEIAGVTERTLKKWEIDCGRADSFALHRLCRAYGISFSHVYFGKEEDLLEARREAKAMEDKRGPIRLEDIISAFKAIGKDTSELEEFCEEIRRSREAEMKNRPNAATLASTR